MPSADHDAYGKRIFADILGHRWRDSLDAERSVEMAGVRADLDGIIRSRDGARVECAIEIEARVFKQIRGAIIDLSWHPAPKKMLAVIRAQPQLGSEEKVSRHCIYVWNRLNAGREVPFRLVILKGTGAQPLFDEDRALVLDALRKLDIEV